MFLNGNPPGPKAGNQPPIRLSVFALAGIVVGVWAALSGPGLTATPASSASSGAEAAQLTETPALTEVTRSTPFGRWHTTIGLTLLAASGMAFWAVRRRERGDQDLHTLNVLSRVKLGGRWQISLVEVPGRLLVVGTTEKGVTLLSELTPNGAPLPDNERVPTDQPRTAEMNIGMDSPIVHDLEDSETRRRRILSTLPPSKVDALFAGVQTSDDEPFLNHLVNRLNDARPMAFSAADDASPTATTRPEPRVDAGVDERSAIRYRVQQYRRGPARL